MNIFSFIYLSIVVVTSLKFLSINSITLGHLRVGLHQLSFLFKMSHVFLFCCLLNNFGVYPGLYEWYVKFWILFCFSEED